MKMRIKVILLFSIPACLFSVSYAQPAAFTVSGIIKNITDKSPLSFVNIVLKKEKDSAFVTGAVSNEEGRFTLSNVSSGNYILAFSHTGFISKSQPVLIGSLSSFLDLGTIELQQGAKHLQEVVVSSSRQDDVNNKMDKKSLLVASNISQSGGSVLQALKNLPGITTTQDGKVELRSTAAIENIIFLIKTEIPWR